MGVENQEGKDGLSNGVSTNAFCKTSWMKSDLINSTGFSLIFIQQEKSTAMIKTVITCEEFPKKLKDKLDLKAFQ